MEANPNPSANPRRKLILSGGVAKRLINRGHLVVDLKPKRDNPKESAFLFFADSWLHEDVNAIMQGGALDDADTMRRRLAALGISAEEYRRRIFEEYLASA